jgi:hypothetical protein
MLCARAPSTSRSLRDWQIDPGIQTARPLTTSLPRPFTTHTPISLFSLFALFALFVQVCLSACHACQLGMGVFWSKARRDS